MSVTTSLSRNPHADHTTPQLFYNPSEDDDLPDTVGDGKSAGAAHPQITTTARDDSPDTLQGGEDHKRAGAGEKDQGHVENV